MEAKLPATLLLLQCMQRFRGKAVKLSAYVLIFESLHPWNQKNCELRMPCQFRTPPTLAWDAGVVSPHRGSTRLAVNSCRRRLPMLTPRSTDPSSPSLLHSQALADWNLHPLRLFPIMVSLSKLDTMRLVTGESVFWHPPARSSQLAEQ